MPADRPPFDELSALWRDQDLDTQELDMQTLIDRAETFDRRIRNRNALEFVACGIVLAFFLPFVFLDVHLLTRIAGLEIAASAVLIAVVMRVKGGHRSPDPSLDTVAYLQAHAAGLKDQARLLATVPLWYISPLALGLVLFIGGRTLDDMAAGGSWVPGALSGAVCAVVCIVIGAANLVQARRLRSQAETLLEQAERNGRS